MRQNTRGQILILTAFFVFLLFTLALAFFKLLPVELNSALRTRQAVSAQVAANSGIKEAIVWLEGQPPQKVLTQAILDLEFNDSIETDPLTLSAHWSYRCRITPNPDGVFLYDIVSEALFYGRPVRQARATVSRANFARYALFIDRWPSDLLYSMSPEAVRGPFHTNDFFRLGVPDPNFWNPGQESFVSGGEAIMTHARSFTGGSLPFEGDGNAYYNGASINASPDYVPYDEDGAIEARYDAIVEGGQSNMVVTNHIELPYSADQLRLAALDMGGELPPFTPPAEVGFYLPGTDDTVTGGIFVVGNARIELALSSEGNQIHNITQIVPEEAYRVEEDVVLQRPIYDQVWVEPPPGQTVTVREYETRVVDVIRQEITGYRQETRTRTERIQTGVRQETQMVGGITQIVTVPVFETRTITETVDVPIYEDVPGQETRTVWTGNYIEIDAQGRYVNQLVGYEPYTDTQVHFITPEQYDADPGAYPDAQRVFLPGGEESGQVVEVTSEDGYAGNGVTAVKGQTVIKDYDGAVTVKDGNLNGVTFVDGDVTSLQGTTKGALGVGPLGEEAFQGRYIVANPDWGRELKISDDLLAYYDGEDSSRREPGRAYTLRIGELSPTSEHALGLVANEIRMAPASNDPLIMYSVILAGRGLRGPDGEPLRDGQGRPQVAGGFGTDDPLLTGGYGLNRFQLFGGLVQANALSWNRLGTGLTGNLIYDPAVADGLPRFPRSQEIVILRYADQYVANE